MRIIRSKPGKEGKVVLTVELNADEEIIAVNENTHYKLGYPVEDIVSGNIIAEAQRVCWCSVEQKWAE